MRKFFFDVKAFYLIRKEVRKRRNSPDWQRFSLRHDWLYRMYTVVNPTTADKGDDEQMITMKTLDRIAPINKYIASMGLAEVLSLSVEKIPDTDSHLVVYYQIYKWFTPWRIFSRLFFLILGTVLLSIYWNELLSLFS
jgi:hypothetical protein